jgi:hypothetical protein
MTMLGERRVPLQSSSVEETKPTAANPPAVPPVIALWVEPSVGGSPTGPPHDAHKSAPKANSTTFFSMGTASYRLPILTRRSSREGDLRKLALE